MRRVPASCCKAMSGVQLLCFFGSKHLPLCSDRIVSVYLFFGKKSSKCAGRVPFKSALGRQLDKSFPDKQNPDTSRVQCGKQTRNNGRCFAHTFCRIPVEE
eukprot:GEMP01102351.1.p1 GENE.GEMP01102351.1~~GEMP01102351.1.p1  ORF type:complete len:101 (-),score=1.99 GEMP01102351.1:24-326(-)